MKRSWLFTLTIVFTAQFLWAQVLTQTVRGTVVDVDSKYPLMGATVSIGDLKVVTDESGQFTLTGIPLGRQTVLTPSPLHICYNTNNHCKNKEQFPLFL